ncbi:hypothetical protein [Endozoicomonas numazuensis]|uniref:Uncharacterized protein n=1 Tax=Endozoicomonas numazuensis TaxID=1137799 RepID=A0A081NDX6_9GAMM|nr:hypothetical protein [Endozoicomonas numazuensis]KEQ16649.1 hypothetical protein GZ78_22810 [Endozoicomonas numazuensis]
MKIAQSALQLAKVLLSPSWLKGKIRLWKHRLIRVVWLKFGYIAKSSRQSPVEKTFSFNDPGKTKEVKLLRPHFNCELPGLSFRMFLQELDTTDPELWLDRVFADNRSRLLRFRPDQKQTEAFLIQLENVFKTLPDLNQRKQKLKALEMIKQFNRDSPGLCVDSAEPSVLAFNLALRLCDPGLLTAQVRLPIASDPGFSGTNLCGPTATMSLFCHQKPELFTRFTLDLATRGMAKADGFSLKVPTIMRAVPEYLGALNPFERILLGSFISTQAGFGKFKGVYPVQLKKWLHRLGWKGAKQVFFTGGEPGRIKNRHKLANSIKESCDKSPIILFGDSGVVIHSLPGNENSNHYTTEPENLTKSGSLHFTAVLACKILDEERVRLTVNNYGRIYDLHISKTDLARFTEQIISLDGKENNQKIMPRNPQG